MNENDPADATGRGFLEGLVPAVRQMLRDRRIRRRAKRDWQRFEKNRAAHRAQYQAAGFSVRRHDDVVRTLRQDGFAVLKQAIALDVVAGIRRDLEEHLNHGTCLNPVTNDAARRPGDLSAAEVRLEESLIARGPTAYRHLTNNVAVREPLLNAPSAVGVVFDDRLIDIATDYLDCFPAVGGLNLRKSFANGLGAFDTQYYHCDRNAPMFLKYFVYLNDVDRDGGPFCYVRGSHRDKPKGWNRKYRWTHEEIVDMYGEERVEYLTAQVGDLIVADTTGFHRGTPLVGHDRGMLTVNYVTQPEFDGTHQFQISAATMEALSAKQKATTDFLRVVEPKRGSNLAA